MTLRLELPATLERELTAEAKRMGLPLDEYALRVLAARGASGLAPRSGTELVRLLEAEGVIGGRYDIVDSADCARQMRAEAERRDDGSCCTWGG